MPPGAFSVKLILFKKAFFQCDRVEEVAGEQKRVMEKMDPHRKRTEGMGGLFVRERVKEKMAATKGEVCRPLAH